MLLNDHLSMLLESTAATLFMVFTAACVSIFFGLPIAILLTVTGKGRFLENQVLHRILSMVVTLGRSVPFVILMVALIPLTRFVVGSSIGTTAAIVPLSIAAIPFFARIVEGKLASVDGGILEAALAMGFSPGQIIRKVLLPEAIPGISNAITILLVSLVEYSAMAGAVGGSGLGSTAIQYGYYQFDTLVMMEALIILVGLVLVLQFLGDRTTKYLSRHIKQV
jgi:D-methionine transport system permease protein